MRNFGFTLIECLLALALSALLLTGTIHTYQNFTSRNKVSYAMTGWVNTLRFARTHALVTGKTTTICPGISDLCDHKNYADGWFVFTENITGTSAHRDPNESIIATAAPLNTQLHLQTNIAYPIHFYADGRTNTNGHFMLCNQSGEASADGVFLIRSGRLRFADTEELDGIIPNDVCT